MQSGRRRGHGCGCREQAAIAYRVLERVGVAGVA